MTSRIARSVPQCEDKASSCWLCRPFGRLSKKKTKWVLATRMRSDREPPEDLVSQGGEPLQIKNLQVGKVE